ncbi:tyrosine phenol-lyase [Dehalococcoidia bacterium]|nr:tyrosine phenol-lyase [Dehalococcoidia bacterium]
MKRARIPEPYKIKMVEHIRLLPPEARRQAIQEAGYNTFLFRSEDVFIDLLTDSGTSAMSDRQWSALMVGDEAYAGARSFYRLEEAVREIYGFPYLVPTHQGRAAEHITAQLRIKPGQFVPMNMYFTTTREHLERAGGVFFDCIIDEAHDPQARHPFKGNVDLEKLDRLVREHGPDSIAFLWLAPCVNMAGGQPFSMANLREVARWAKDQNIPIILDATRAVENCYFIKVREEGYEDKPIKEIPLEMMSYAESITMSAKKDNLVNIGGFIATRNQDFFQAARATVVVFEGLHTYGGLAGRDMEAMVVGMREMVDDAYIESRVEQVQRFGQALLEAGIPIVEPVGGHAVFIDAKRFLPHLSQDVFPAQALAAEIYLEGGVRSMERGVVSAGRDPKTGKHRYPKLELVRLTIPRRVYTDSHLAYVVDVCRGVYERRDGIRGLEMVYEPPQLRFFQARFQPL